MLRVLLMQLLHTQEEQLGQAQLPQGNPLLMQQLQAQHPPVQLPSGSSSANKASPGTGDKDKDAPKS